MRGPATTVGVVTVHTLPAHLDGGRASACVRFSQGCVAYSALPIPEGGVALATHQAALRGWQLEGDVITFCWPSPGAGPCGAEPNFSFFFYSLAHPGTA